MACELTGTCIFFNDKMHGKPAMLALYKAQYCHGDFAHCARYMIYAALGRENVPSDLYPNDRLRSIRILRSANVEVSGVSVPMGRTRAERES